MRIEVLQENLINFFIQRCFARIASQGLEGSSFPDTFNPSAFHDFILTIANRQAPLSDPEKYVGVERVFRHVDLGHIAVSADHLSTFSMFVFFQCIPNPSTDRGSYRETIQLCVALFRSLGLDSSKFLVTYFGGGEFGRQVVALDQEMLDFWREAGVKRSLLIEVKGNRNFTNFKRPGEPAGPRCEIFYPKVDGNYVEVATVVFEKYVLNHDGELKPLRTRIYGAAIGVERLMMLLENKANIFDCSVFSSINSVLAEKVGVEVFRKQRIHINQLVDSLRSLTAIINNIGLPVEKARYKRLKKLRNITMKRLEDLPVNRQRSLMDALAEKEPVLRKVWDHNDFKMLLRHPG